MDQKNIFKVIVLGIALVMIISFVASLGSTYNGAIKYEEQVQQTESLVNVQEKRRLDLILNLVQVVEQNADYEQGTLSKVVEARGQAQVGNIKEAGILLNAVVEAYPELKANNSYIQLMTELSVTENLIAEYRKTYNGAINEYNKFIRVFPKNIVLSIVGYDKKDYQYLEFEAIELPKSLFTK